MKMYDVQNFVMHDIMLSMFALTFASVTVLPDDKLFCDKPVLLVMIIIINT